MSPGMGPGAGDLAYLGDLVDAALSAVEATGPGRRCVLGVVGAPGAGKSTLVDHLLLALRARPPAGAGEEWVAHLPMDGFHLADVQLDRLGRRDRKGAPNTFDVDGFAATLRRCRDDLDHPIYVPGFERDLEQPIAAALVVLPAARLVVTEGNYLLHDGDGWGQVAPLLDRCWYAEVDDAVRRERLVARHVRFGKSPAHAQAWVESVDEPNARLIRAGRSRADRVVAMP